MNWFKKLFSSLKSDNTSDNNIKIADEDYFIDLEEKLLTFDCGLEFSEYLIENIKKPPNPLKGEFTTKQVEEKITNLCKETLQNAYKPNNFNTKNKRIIFITGVNGSGKTTSIGKLAYFFKNLNKKILIAPCDTFRAAAGEQLEKWANRSNVSFHSPSQGKNQRPDSVLFEAITKMKTENFDMLLVDTAGRLQNKKELMDELARLSKVIEKHSDSNIEIDRWLVIDATTGQNGYQQAVAFNEVSPLSGLILTKFDGSAKGGIVFAISHKLKIPIKFIGIGEQIDKLEIFNPEKFVEEIFS